MDIVAVLVGLGLLVIPGVFIGLEALVFFSRFGAL